MVASSLTAAFRSRVAGTAAAATLALAFPGAAPLHAALGSSTTCVAARPNGTGGCTANDLTVVLVGLGTVADGCVNASDSNLSMQLGVTVRTTTSQTRYDVGIFVDRENVDALHGSDGVDAVISDNCAVEALHPTNGTACSGLNLSGGSGPYLDTDGDFCGDLQNVNSACGDSYIQMPLITGMPCKAGVTPDGWVHIAGCLTYGNNQNQVGDIVAPNGSCDSENDLHAGTTSKCQCDNSAQTNIPLPNLGLTCGCTRVNSRTYNCFAQYTNTISPACTNPTPAPALRFRCGTAGYARFQDDYDQTISSITSITTASTPSGYSGTGTDTGTVLNFNPQSSVTTAGSRTDIISPNDTSRINYTLNISPSVVTDGTLIPNTWVTQWSNDDSSFVSQSLTADCSVYFNATWAEVSNVHAVRRGNAVSVEWETAAEVASLGFDVFRVDPVSGAQTKITRQPLASAIPPPGGAYRVPDPEAGRATTLTYRIVEREMGGAENSYGPYTLQVRDESPVGRSANAAAFPTRTPRQRKTAAARSTADAATLASAAVPLSERAKLIVHSDGFYRVSAADLATGTGKTVSQVASAILSGYLHLSGRGTTIAWQPEPNGGGIRFVGRGPIGTTEPENVYWAGIEYGDRMTKASASKATTKTGVASLAERLHIEQDLDPWPEGTQDPSSDWWFWTLVAAGVPGYDTSTVDFDVPDVTAGASSIEVELYGYPSTAVGGEYRTTILLNGTTLGDAVWYAAGTWHQSFQLPASLLAGGTNHLTIVGVKGGVLLDSVNASYRRLPRAPNDQLTFTAESASQVVIGGFSGSAISLYDISKAGAPQILAGAAIATGAGGYSLRFVPIAGHRYLAVGPNGIGQPEVRTDLASSLHAGSNAADYLVITDGRLLEAAQALADYRTATGFATQVVDVQDIFDEFSYGLRDAKAIHSFLAWASTHWQSPPRFVTLAGRGTFDVRDIYQAHDDFVPVMLANSIVGLVAADVQFSDFDGDGVPEIPIGRIPATSNAELQGFVDKLAAYEADSGVGWSALALTVADEPQDGLDFPAQSAALGTLLAAEGRTVVPLHMASSADAPAVRTALLAGLDSGAGMFNYLGHAGYDRLASEGLLLASDVPALANGQRLPVLTAQTCYVNYFFYPGFPSIGEQLTLAPGGGVLASWAPGGPSINNPAVEMGSSVVEHIAQAGSGRLGERIRAGLVEYYAAGGSRLNGFPYNLIGDPATEVK